MKTINILEIGDKILEDNEVYIYRGLEENGYHLFESLDEQFTCDNDAFYRMADQYILQN